MTVKRALHYARLMDAAGQDNAYQRIEERPESASRWSYAASTLAVADVKKRQYAQSFWRTWDASSEPL